MKGLSGSSARVIIWLLLVAVLAFGAFRHATWMGDSPEYLLYTLSFASHGNASITPAQIEGARAELVRDGQAEKAAKLELWTSSEGVRLSDKAVISDAMIRTADGNLYTFHFWLYAALVSVIYLLVHALGGGVLAAFAGTNVLLAAGVLGYVFFERRSGRATDQRVALALLFSACGTIFYIWWPHPEVFTAGLVLLGFLLAADRRFGPGLMCVAVAATQNPPLLLALPILALAYAAGSGALVVRDRKVHLDWRAAIPVVTWCIGAAAIAVLPIVFFVTQTGVSNPIVTSGLADASLINFNRFLSLWFDPNMGVLAGAPGLLLLVIAVLLASVLPFSRDRSPGARSRALSWLVAGAIVSALISVPTLMTTNWNHGQTVYSRYAYWVPIPLLLSAVLASSGVVFRWRVSAFSAALLLQLFIVGYSGVWGDKVGYQAFKPAARLLLAHAPQLYDPVPSIFAERSVAEGEEIDMFSPAAQLRVFRYPPEGGPAKVLMHRSNDLLSHSPCWKHALASGMAIEEEGGWLYFNRPICSFHEPGGMLSSSNSQSLASAEGADGVLKD